MRLPARAASATMALMETEFLDWLRGRLGRHRRLPLGINDDAALLEMLAGGTAAPGCVLTVDLLTEGVDFRLAETTPERIGRKALAVSLSDLAAMAARPLAALVAAALPRADALNLAKRLYGGLLPLAERYDVAIAGGDTNTWDGPLVISVTAVGEVGPRGPLRRDGARPGDAILVTGDFGGSILGKHFDFEPRIEESLLLQDRYELHAGMDVSDGLSLDLSRMCAASGCGAVLEVDAVPISDAAIKVAAERAGGTTPLEHALTDGEDFELLLAAPLEEAQRLVAEQPLSVPLTIVGEFIAQPGLWRRESGQLAPLAARGYLH